MTDVAIFIPSLRGGGAEKVAVTLANGIAATDRQVDLVIVRAEGPYLSDVASNVRVVDLHCTRVLSSIPSLARYLRRAQPMVLLAFMKHANVAAVIAATLARSSTRVFISEHANYSRSAMENRSINERIVRMLMPWTYRRAAGITAVSRGVADDLISELRLDPVCVKVIYNPVVTDRLLRLSAEPLDHPWAKGHVPIFIGIGRLTSAKNFPLLINAFAKVRETVSCRLVILGEGELRNELEALVEKLGMEEDVYMPGFVANPYQWLVASTAFVLSSNREGLPTVLIEALVCGTRCISTDCPSGPAEILKNGKLGYLIPCEDQAALVTAMNRALHAPPELQARKHALTFNQADAVAAYLDYMLPELDEG